MTNKTETKLINDLRLKKTGKKNQTKIKRTFFTK